MYLSNVRMKILLLLFMVLPVFALCEENLIATQASEFPVVPGMQEDGFLLSGEEYVLEDAENGLWRYVSDSLRVDIVRYSAENAKQIWYVSHIYQQGELGIHTWLSNPKNPTGAYKLPSEIARMYGVVFATNGDFFADRVGDSGPMGAVIRNGEIIGRHRERRNKIPTLDVMALYPDGSVKCYDVLEYSAGELLEKGATDTLCFGPILITDSELQTKRIERLYPAREPRCAVGMIKPGEYIFIVTEGRTETSEGTTLKELSELMYEEGCVEALNLDGGQTTVMSFMGNQINKTGRVGNSTGPRKMTDIIGVGYSELVLQPE